MLSGKYIIARKTFTKYSDKKWGSASCLTRGNQTRHALLVNEARDVLKLPVPRLPIPCVDFGGILCNA